MNDQHSNNQELVVEGSGAYTVITVSFADDHNAYNALTALKLDSQKRVGVQEAVGRAWQMGRWSRSTGPNRCSCPI